MNMKIIAQVILSILLMIGVVDSGPRSILWNSWRQRKWL